MKVTLHQFSHHIYFFKVVDVRRLQNVQSRKHVFMFEEAQHLQLTEHPLTGNKVLEDIGHLFEGYSLPVSGVRHRPDDPKRSVSNGSVGLYVELLLQVVLLLVLVVVVVNFASSGGLDLCRSRGRRRPGGLPGGRRGEVRLLLARVEHHRRSCRRGAVLLDRVHGGGGARVLQVVLSRVVVVVVVVVHVGGRKVLQLVVVVRVMGSHCRGASVISSHHFCNIGRSCAAQSHKTMREASKSDNGGDQAATLHT